MPKVNLTQFNEFLSAVAQEQQVEDAIKEELNYLRWFHANTNFGPAEGDVRCGLQNQYEDETGHKVPKSYDWRVIEE